MKGILTAQISSGTNVVESLDLLADDIAGMGKSALQYLQGLDHCLLAHSSPLVEKGKQLSSRTKELLSPTNRSPCSSQFPTQLQNL